jgi:hypothetical protein
LNIIIADKGKEREVAGKPVKGKIEDFPYQHLDGENHCGTYYIGDNSGFFGIEFFKKGKERKAATFATIYRSLRNKIGNAEWNKNYPPPKLERKLMLRGVML